MLPVEGRIATTALAGPTPASAASAWVCSRGSSVVRSGSPLASSVLNSSRSSEPSSPPTAETTIPGVPASCSSYRACRPDSPTSSPGWIAPSDFFTISAVAGPTRPRIGAANSRVGASGTSPPSATAPLIPLSSAPLTEPASASRSTSASMNALGPAALTSLAYAAGSMSSSTASARAEATARAAGTLVLSMPKRTTGRRVTSGSSAAPRMSPRRACSVVASSDSPSVSDGSTTDGARVAVHPPSPSARATSVS